MKLTTILLFAGAFGAGYFLGTQSVAAKSFENITGKIGGGELV